MSGPALTDKERWVLGAIQGGLADGLPGLFTLFLSPEAQRAIRSLVARGLVRRSSVYAYLTAAGRAALATGALA